MLLTKMQDVTLPDLNGNSVSISDYKGKNTLIFMWASW
jgi:peroxiredoxin